MAVAVVLALLSGVAPAAASQWDTQDDTAGGSVQDAYPYKTSSPSQLDPRGFSYGSGASYAAWYLADNGVTINAEMPGADGPAPLRFATGRPFNSGTGSWVTSTWRLGFRVKDDAKAHLGDLYVGSDGSWIGVVYEAKDGWVTVAGYKLGSGAAGFAIKKLRVAAGDCACVLDYLNTPLDAGQGGVKVEDETVYDMIRRRFAGDAHEVSPPAVDSTGAANGWVSLDGEASYLHANSPQDVSFPAGGSFDVNAAGWVLYNRTWGDEFDGYPAPGWNPTGEYSTGVSLSPNLDHAAWITDAAMLPEDECADGVQHYSMAYQGQILDVSSLWYRMPLLADPEYWVLSASGVRVNPDPVPVGSVPSGASGLCVPEPGRAVHTRDLYTTDLHTGDSSIATPPQLNSDTRYGQESHLGGDVHAGPRYTQAISDDGVVTLKATARAAAGYPTESPQGYLPSPLRERVVQAINLVLGAVPTNTPLYAPWAMAPPDPGWWALEHVPALGEGFQDTSVEMTQSDWPAPTRLTPPCATFVGRGYWCKHDTAYFTFRNAGPWRTLVGTYDVKDPAGSWNEVWGTGDDDMRSVVTVPASGDVLRPSPDLGSLQRYAPLWAACDNSNLCPPLSASLTPSGRWWHSEAEMDEGYGGVCLEGVASGDRYDCRPMTGTPGGLVERTGPNDDGEFVAIYSAEGSGSNQPGQYAAVWRPGRDHKMKMSAAALLPEIGDGGGAPWRVVGVSGVSQKTPTGRRTLATYERGGSSTEQRFAIVEIPDRVSVAVPHPEVASGSGATRGQGVVAGGGRWEVGTRTEAEHGGEMQGSRKGLVGVAVKRDTGDAAPSGAAFYEFSSPSRRWRVIGRRWDSLRVDTAPQAYRLERPGSTAFLRGPCDVYSVPNTGGKQPFLIEPFVDRRGTYCTWTFTEGSPSGNAGGAAEFSLNVTRANGGQVVLDVPRTAVPLGPSNQMLVDAAGYDKPLSALGKRLERAAKNLAAGLVDELSDDVAAIDVDYEVQHMLETLDPWVDHQLAELKSYALEWIDRLPPWLEDHVFTPMEEWITKFVDRWGVNFDWVRAGIEELVQAPIENLQTFCENIAGSAVDMADAFEATLSHPLFAGWGVNLDDQGTLAETIATFTDWANGICGDLGAAAEAALTNALDTFVTAPLDALVAAVESAAANIKALIATRTDELRAQVNGAIANLRASVAGFDLGSLKGVPVDPIGTCPAEGEPGYDRNCRIDLVRDWARHALLAAHDWIIDQVYEPNADYDYHHPTGCGGTMRILKALHCAVEEGRTAYMEALTDQLAPVDAAIHSFATGLSAITTGDEYDRLFHCVAGIAPTITQAMSGIPWNLGGGSGIFGFFASGWANWFAGGDGEGESPLKPNIVECLLPTPGGWWPNDADWLPLGPWQPEQVERVLYAAMDFLSNAVADGLSRISVDGGNVNAVGRAVLQMLVNLSKRTITLDGEPVPGTYFEALDAAVANGGSNTVSWEQVWGYLTDGMDGFTGAGFSDWKSIQSGMRCTEVRYDGEWWYDKAPGFLKSAFDAAGFLQGCAKGGWVDGSLKYFLEDPGRFLGRPLVERYTYLWDNPEGLGESIHHLLDTWEKRLVAWVQARLPDGLRALAGWIRSAGAAAKPQVENALHDQVAELMALLQVRAGEAVSPAEAAVNAAADRVVATLDRLADTLETQAAAPWLREVAQLVAWANARLRDALTGVEAVVSAVRSWVGGLGLSAELEAAIFGLLDQIHDAVVDAGQWVQDNAVEPVDAQLNALLRMAFGAIADAIRSQGASVYALRDSLVGKFNAWLTGWAEQVAKSCGEGHTESPEKSVGVCDVVAEPVGTVFDAGVNWIAGGIENLADVIESRVSGAPRSIRAYLDDLNCELVLYVYDIQSVTQAVCDRINAGQPPFAVKKSSETLLNLLADQGEELKTWILDELAKAAGTIRGFDLDSERLWAGMDATVQSGMGFAMFAVDPDVRAALGEYLRHALSRVARYVEPMSDREALEAVGGELGLPDLYNVIVNQVNEVVPFVRAQVYSILGSLPNIDSLTNSLRSATSPADVANALGSFGDYLLTWVIAVVDDVTGDFLDLNAKVASAIGDSVLRVADNALRAAIDGAVNVFRFVVWAHEYTFEKAIAPLIALGDEVPDMWEAPAFGRAQVQGAFAEGVQLEMRFAQDHAGSPVGGAIASYPSVSRPGEWYVVASRSFGVGSFTQPALTLEELDGNDGTLDVTGICNVYRASGPSLAEAVSRESSGNCRWVLDGRVHTLGLSGPLPEWTEGTLPLEDGAEVVQLVRPWGIPLLEAGDMAARVQAGEAGVDAGALPGDADGEPGDPTFPAVEHWIEDTLGFRGRFSPELVSATATGGVAASASHQVGGVSPDGRYVVFASEAEDVVAGDHNAKRDIFLRDRFTRTTAALSTTPGGATGNSHSARPSMSRDGTTAAFASSASDLVTGDTNAQTDVFVRDLVTGAMERVSVPAGGGEADDASTEPVVSGDGRYVAFLSVAGNLVAGDTNGAFDAFVADRAAGTLERVSVADDGGELPGGAAYAAPAPGLPWGTSIGISDDGDRVVFSTSAGGVFVRDRGLGTTRRVDVNDAGDPANSASARPAISGDGRYVVFATGADNLAGGDDPPDGNGLVDVYRHDIERGRTRRVSSPAFSEAGESNGTSGEWIPAAALGGDGRWVVFESTATNLTGAVGNGERQLYARDMRSSRVQALSATSAGVPGDGGSGGARIGGNSAVAFTSEAANLVGTDTNGAWDVFVSDALTPFETWMQTRLLWWLEGEEGYLADLDARRAREELRQAGVEDLAGSVYEMFAAFLGHVVAPGDGEGGPVLVNVTPWGAVGTSGYIAPSTPSASSDGRYVVFSSVAADLVVGDGDGVEDVFRRDVENGSTVRVSENNGTGREPDGASSDPVVSGDGRDVAYVTRATNLTAPGAPAVAGSGVILWDADTGTNELVPDSEGATGDVAMSGDGRYVVYGVGSSYGSTGALRVYRYDRDTSTTTLVNVPVSGNTPDALSYSLDVSDDGRYVLFVSEARNLHAGDDGSYLPNVLVRDVDAGVTSSAGVQTRPYGYGACERQEAAISGDGRYVVFDSCAANVAGDTNGKDDVYRYEIATGAAELMSVTDGGAQGNNESFLPAVSDAGRFVVFSSSATNLDPAAGAVGGVLVRDTAAGTTRHVSVAWDGTPLAGSAYRYESPAVSGDGTRAVFHWGYATLYSATTNPPPAPGSEAIAAQTVVDALNAFMSDWLAGRSPEERAAVEADAADLLARLVAFIAPVVTGDPVPDPRLLSANSAAEPGNAKSYDVAAAPDGAAGVFTSEAANLVDGDTNAKADVFAVDADTGAPERVSVASDGTQANNESAFGSLSAGGRQVAFTSQASNLVAGDTNGVRDVFVHDRDTGVTERVSVASGGSQATGYSSYGVSYGAAISADGRYVAFASDSSNLVAGDTNGVRDVFVHDRDTGVTERVSVASDGTQGNGRSSNSSSCQDVAISADGRFVGFGSAAGNLVAGDTNGWDDIFVHDRDTAVTERVSVASDGTQGNRRSGDQTCKGFSSYYYGQASPTLSLSGDGRFVAFISGATNLVAGDTNTGSDWEDPGYGSPDVFVHDRDADVTTRVNVASDGTQSSSASWVSMSPDASLVGFASGATFGDPYDTNGTTDAFVHDMATAETRRVSVGAGGAQAQGASAGVALASADRAVIASVAPNLLDPPIVSTSPQAYLVTTLPRAVDVGDDVTNLLESVMGVVNQWKADAQADTPPDASPGHILVGAVRDLLAQYESAAGIEWLRRLVAGERAVRDLMDQLADIWNGTYLPPSSPVVPPAMYDGIVARADGISDAVGGLAETLDRSGAEAFWSALDTQASATRGDLGSLGNIAPIADTADLAAQLDALEADYETGFASALDDLGVRFLAATADLERDDYAAFLGEFKGTGEALSLFNRRLATFVAEAQRRLNLYTAAELAQRAERMRERLSLLADVAADVEPYSVIDGDRLAAWSALSQAHEGLLEDIAYLNGSQFVLDPELGALAADYRAAAEGIEERLARMWELIGVPTNQTDLGLSQLLDQVDGWETGATATQLADLSAFVESTDAFLRTDVADYLASRWSPEELAAAGVDSWPPPGVEDQLDSFRTAMEDLASLANPEDGLGYYAAELQRVRDNLGDWWADVAAGVAPPRPGEPLYLWDLSDAASMFRGDVAPLVPLVNGMPNLARLQEAETVAGAFDALEAGMGEWFYGDGHLATPLYNRLRPSADGRYVAFSTLAALDASDTNGIEDLYLWDASDRSIRRVSHALSGGDSDGPSLGGQVSADGRYVLFWSGAANLVADDTNGAWDVFRYDTQSGEAEIASVAADGAPANSASERASLSADGRYVAFASYATNLVGGFVDDNGSMDVFVRDMATSTTEVVSVAADGSAASASTPNFWIASRDLDISADGRYVAFLSEAEDLVADDNDVGNSQFGADVFVRDRTTASTTRVNTASDGSEDDGGAVGGVRISDDGRHVGYLSRGTNLVAGADANGDAPDAYVMDRDTGDTQRVNITDTGEQFSTWDRFDLSGDGRYVVFGATTSYLRDLTTGTTTVATLDRDGQPYYGHTQGVYLDGNGDPQVLTDAMGTLQGPGNPDGWSAFEQLYTTTADGPLLVSARPNENPTTLGDVTAVMDQGAALIQLILGPDFAAASAEAWHVDLGDGPLAERFRSHIAAVSDFVGNTGVSYAPYLADMAVMAGDLSARTAALAGVVDRFAVSAAGDSPIADAILEAIARVTGWLGESPAGLEAAYYAGPAPLGVPVEERIDKTVDFDWGGGGPGGLTDDFSAAWRGRVVSPVTGSVEFTVESDDGARLWIDDNRVIDDWATPGGDAVSVDVDLVAGVPRKLRLEYREDTGSAGVRLMWRLPGEPDPVPVPSSALLAGEPRVGDLPRVITGLSRFGSAAAVALGRAETDVARDPGAPRDVFTALLIAPAPYDDPQGSLSYSYRDGGERVTVSTTGLDAVDATGIDVVVHATCATTVVPVPMDPLSPPRREGPFPCTWALRDDYGTTRLDVSAAGVSNVAVLPTWRFSLHYPS